MAILICTVSDVPRAGRKGTAISLVEAHDHLLLGKVGRYIEEPIKARVIDELRPKNACAKREADRQAIEESTGKTRREEKAKEKEKPRVKNAIATPKILVSAVNQAERACHRKRQKSNLNAGFKPGIVFIPAKNTLQHTE